MKSAGSVFFSLGRLSKRFFDKIGHTLYKEKPTIKGIAWGKFCDAGGESLRYDYDTLNASSVVFDLGGYEGQWTSDIYSRFRPKILVFEVYAPYYENIKNRFRFNDDIVAYNFGLSSADARTSVSIDEYSTSEFIKSDNMTEIDLKNASDFISEKGIDKISLMKINIEGGEYQLLDHLIDSGTVSIIENLLIQFHEFVPNAFEEMTRIRAKLSVTHYATFQFDFLWDNWRLKGL